MLALLLDTETTGLIDNHTVKIARQPHLTEYYGCLANIDDGSLESEVSVMVRPPEAIPSEVQLQTGITDEMVKDCPPFSAVAETVRKQIEGAPLVIAQNLSFDMEMIGLEFERMSQVLTWPKKKICTVEQTVHLKGYRLSLSDLHDHLFGMKFDGAHRAKNDVMAMLKCVVELRKRGQL